MYELEFTDREIRIVLNALDFYSRIWIGQYDHILWELRWYRNCSQLDALDKTLRRKFWDMRNIILPELRKYYLNGSYGIFSPDRDVKAAIAYDMQLRIVIDALNIGIFVYNCQIRKLFEYYTDDPEALAIADELTDILASIDTEYPVKNEQYYDMIQRLFEIRTNK